MKKSAIIAVVTNSGFTILAARRGASTMTISRLTRISHIDADADAVRN